MMTEEQKVARTQLAIAELSVYLEQAPLTAKNAAELLISAATLAVQAADPIVAILAVHVVKSTFAENPRKREIDKLIENYLIAMR